MNPVIHFHDERGICDHHKKGERGGGFENCEGGICHRTIWYCDKSYCEEVKEKPALRLRLAKEKERLLNRVTKGKTQSNVIKEYEALLKREGRRNSFLTIGWTIVMLCAAILAVYLTWSTY